MLYYFMLHGSSQVRNSINTTLSGQRYLPVMCAVLVISCVTRSTARFLQAAA
jgi:hypothetical protein